MQLLAPVTQLTSAFRKFVAPRYRPELYYMRGPGPAYARRMSTLEAQLQGPPFGGDTRDGTNTSIKAPRGD